MPIIPHRKYLSWSLQCVIISNYEYDHRICSSQDALVHLLFMHYTLNFTYSFRNISADVHLYLKDHRKWYVKLRDKVLAQELWSTGRSTIFPHGGVVTRGRQPSAETTGCGRGSPESWLQTMVQSIFPCFHLYGCLVVHVSLVLGMVGLVCSCPSQNPSTGCVYRLWVFTTGKPGNKGILRPPFEDDTARSQCVSEGKKVWLCARETVNLLGRLNFMFK